MTNEIKAMMMEMGFNVEVVESGDKYKINGDTNGIGNVLTAMFGEYVRIGKSYYVVA